MRVFLDTNVLASVAATRGICADVLREVFASHELIISEQVVEELRWVLANKFGVPNDHLDEFVWLLHQDTIVAQPSDSAYVRLRDESDIPIVSAALNANADVFVTGDKEIQNLGQIGAIQFLSPRQFWEKLRTQRDASDEE